jgi:hypothetical protein
VSFHTAPDINAFADVKSAAIPIKEAVDTRAVRQRMDDVAGLCEAWRRWLGHFRNSVSRLRRYVGNSASVLRDQALSRRR